MCGRNDEITLGRETVGGNHGSFLLVHVTRERGSFSVTADEYASRRAFELGNEGAVISCGQLVEEVRTTFPELGVVQDVHLCDVSSGEPMHARSNGWYYLSGEAAQHEMDYLAQHQRKNHYDAPDPYSGEWIPYWRQKAANALHCEPAELPDTQDQDEFNYWVNMVMVPRWKRAADNANAYIDDHKGESIEVPAEQTDEEEFEIELDEGLKVRAVLSDQVPSGIMPGHYVYQYDVIVRAGEFEYEAKFTGSVNDYETGVVNAREAAFGVLRELMSFIYESAQELAASYFEESWDELPEEQREAMLKCERAADAMAGALEANMDVIGA